MGYGRCLQTRETIETIQLINPYKVNYTLQVFLSIYTPGGPGGKQCSGETWNPCITNLDQLFWFANITKPCLVCGNTRHNSRCRAIVSNIESCSTKFCSALCFRAPMSVTRANTAAHIQVARGSTSNPICNQDRPAKSPIYCTQPCGARGCWASSAACSLLAIICFLRNYIRSYLYNWFKNTRNEVLPNNPADYIFEGIAELQLENNSRFQGSVMGMDRIDLQYLSSVSCRMTHTNKLLKALCKVFRGEVFFVEEVDTMP